MKMAGLYRRGDFLFLRPDSKTDRGLWIATPPLAKLSTSISAKDLCAAVRSALAQSKTGIPYPDDPDEVRRPLLELAGVDSSRAFDAEAELCSIDRDLKEWKFMPHQYRGPRLGFYALPKQAMALPTTATDDEIAAAIHSTLDASARAKEVGRRRRD